MFTTEGKEERWRRGKKGGGVFIGGEEARGITPRRCRKLGITRVFKNEHPL
jgi:hypothetical protein